MADDRGNWQRLIDASLEFSRFAVEMSALSEPELRPLEDFLEASGPFPFEYQSIHGPSKEIRSSDAELVPQLSLLANYCDSVVMHPDTIRDYAPYQELGRVLVIENMDARKSDGRTTAELAAVFELLPEAGFCLDIAHAWSIDPTMDLVNELLDEFGNRLRQVHVSSLSSDLSHVELEPGQLEIFLPVLMRCRDVPWIFEASLPPSDIER